MNSAVVFFTLLHSSTTTWHSDQPNHSNFRVKRKWTRHDKISLSRTSRSRKGPEPVPTAQYGTYQRRLSAWPQRMHFAKPPSIYWQQIITLSCPSTTMNDVPMEWLLFITRTRTSVRWSGVGVEEEEQENEDLDLTSLWHNRNEWKMRCCGFAATKNIHIPINCFSNRGAFVWWLEGGHCNQRDN